MAPKSFWGKILLVCLFHHRVAPGALGFVAGLRQSLSLSPEVIVSLCLALVLSDQALPAPVQAHLNDILSDPASRYGCILRLRVRTSSFYGALGRNL